MPTESPIAVRRLRSKWRDGSTHDVTIELGAPYPAGNSLRCPIRINGIQPKYDPPDLAGFDAIQAITLSLEFIRFLLEEHLNMSGRLFYPDEDAPYVPNDLPKP